MTRLPTPTRRRLVWVVVACLSALALAACGSRLDPSVLAQSGGGGGGSAQAGGAGSGTGGGSAGPAGSSLAGVGSTGAGGGPGGSGAGVGATGGSGGGATATATAAGGSTGAAAASSSDNGGATDVGVTANTITIANISDITGVVPGVFESAQVAGEAYANYVNSQGGIYGRKLVVLPYDDQEDSAQNRADVLDACHKAFALVAGTSAFDDESPPAVAQCGIPVVTAGAATDAAAQSPYEFFAGGTFLHAYPTGSGAWFVQHFPSAVKHAAMVYLNAAATIEQAQHRMAGYQAAGFNWVYTTEVSVTEPNYAPYILQMRSKGVQWVSMQADGDSDARFVEAMQQQGWKPQVLALDQAIYSPGFLQSVGHAADGEFMVLNSAMYEDAASNQQVKLFDTWMQRTDPNFPKDDWAFGAWASSALFAQAIRQVGPHLTRSALLSVLKGTGSFDGGGGLISPGAVVSQRSPSPCFMIARIQNGAFTRYDPSSGYICNLGTLFRY